MAITPGSRVGPYDVVSAIGAGGMGEVFLANDTRLGRKVVLKAVLESDRQAADAHARLLHEARAAATLNHPNIASIYDILELDDQTVIVMEYVAGESLSDRLRRGKLRPVDAIDVALQFADGLAEAHRHGIIHRDLKPGNACFTPDGRLKVLDFGIARIRPAEPAIGVSPVTDAVPTVSEPGRMVGTPGYLSLEQLAGGPVDERTDIYSLGVVLFELCTGQLPFVGPDAMAVAMASATEPTPRAHEVDPAVPPTLGEIIARAMAREKEARYQSIESMRADLQRLATPLGERRTATATLTGPPPPVVTSAALTLQQLTTGRVLTAVAIVAAITAGAWFVANSGRQPPVSISAAPTVAVLPFVPDDSTADRAHLGIGMADLVVSALDGLPSVSAVSSSAAISAEATDADLAAIAGGFGATAIVQGALCAPRR